MQDDNAILKETKHIAIGVLIGDVIMCLVFVILKRFGISVILGAILGSVFAVGNIWYLGVSIKKTLEKGEGAQAYFRKTYMVRMLLHGVCIAIAALVPFIDTLAGIIPLFFPKLVIYAMQLLGMYKPEENKA